MTRISDHLSLAEVTKSQTATRLGIDNTPTVTHMIALRDIAENVFEPIRNHFGVPVGISSGYRSKSLNDAIGGSSRSQHCHGQALDIDADIYGRITNGELFRYIRHGLDFDQLIWEFGDDNDPAWVHVSFVKRWNQSREILKAYRDNGRVKYKKIK